MWTIAVVSASSALAGVVLGQFLGAAREHARWVADQRRLEYKQLLDQLYATVTVVDAHRPNLRDFNRDPVDQAVMKLSRLFADRIFLADKLREIGAIEELHRMKTVIYYDPELEDETPQELRFSRNNLHTHEDRLREKLLESAKRDVVRFRFLGLFL